jgi:hypothetical protein
VKFVNKNPYPNKEDIGMRSILVTCSVLGLLALVTIQGCSSGSGPTAPGASERNAESFFDCTTVFQGSQNEPFRDLDIATLAESEDSLATGSPAILSIDGEDTGLSIMVSCLHSSGLLGDQGFLAWLKDDGELIEIQPFGAPGQGSVEYIFPKVDAIYKPGDDQEHSHVIVEKNQIFPPH